MHILESLRSLARRQAGQGLSEYVLINAFFLLSGAFLLQSWAPSMVNGLNVYLHGFYFVLSMPFP
jgi:hypothetical protein